MMSIQIVRPDNFSDSNAIRISHWWNYLLPFFIGVGFCAIYISAIPFSYALQIILLLFITITGTISFGYFINDWSDIEIDRIAGKQNMAAKNSIPKNSLIVFLLLLIALTPWIFLPRNPYNISLYGVQLLLLYAYSVKPLRIKRFVLPCVITDALYNSVVPIFIILFTLLPEPTHAISARILVTILLLFSWSYLKGLRGILLHQLADRKNDQKTSILTFVNHYGPMWSFKLIWRVLFPVEVILFASILIVFSFNYFTGLWIVIPVFVMYLILFLRLWERDRIRNFQFKFSIVYIINDLYEEWLPVVFFGYLAVKDPRYLLVMALYLILFNNMAVKWYFNTKQNLRNIRDLYFLLRGKLGLVVKRIIN